MIRAIESPGPGAYTPLLQRSQIAATLKGRNLRNTSEDTPGPIYRVAVKSDAPAFTMRPRTSMPSDTASSGVGPGSYNIPSAIGRSPGKSISGRHSKSSSSDDVPGPASYNAEVKSTAPSFTMRPRTALPSDASASALGPGSYTLPSVFGASNRTGKSISSRHRTLRGDDVPGPGNVEHFLVNANSTTCFRPLSNPI